jgi:two-component system chemotaxis response regulator CheY
MRALIVDDSRYLRAYLRGLLQERGIDCVEAGDGQEGLDRLHAEPKFDLAFVDWNMPVMNGLQMLKHLRAEEYGDLKAIMVTTEGEKLNILRALAAGADEYLMKPFDREALSEKLALLGVEEA